MILHVGPAAGRYLSVTIAGDASTLTAAAQPALRPVGDHAGVTGRPAPDPASLPKEPIDHGDLVAVCSANLEALAARGIDLREGFAAWRIESARWEWVRVSDGNILRRARDTGLWQLLADTRGPAERARLEFLGPDGRLPAGTKPKPMVVEGIDPPWLLRRLYDATPRTPDGYCPRLIVVQRDVPEALDGLALAPLEDVIADPRVGWFIGERAAARLGEWLEDGLSCAMPDQYLRTPGLREAAAGPSVADVLRGAVDRQGAEDRRLRAEMEAAYHGCDNAYWARRFGEGLAGRGPLRVLIPVSRYSTFVRHSAEDLAMALSTLGHQARVLAEPDDSSLLASVGYLRAFVEWRPDLVVLINHTRRQMAHVTPANIPFVCWTQDTMAHLFDPRLGAAQGPMDFLVGHLWPDLFDKFNYPRRGTLSAPVVASVSKFHGWPVDEAVRRAMECEIQYVSHQSQPPEAMRASLLALAGGNKAIQQAFESAEPALREFAEDPMRRAPHSTLTRIAKESLAGAIGREPAIQLVSVFRTQFCTPYAERLVRHQTLTWAAELAEARGWRFRLYGRGWAEHPRLGAFAAGELEHGEALRASYQCSAVSLQISINPLMHQRVLECAMSGGLPVCRLHQDDLWTLELDVVRGLLERGVGPDYCRVSGRGCYWNAAAHPEIAELLALKERIGLPAGGAAYGIGRASMEYLQAGGDGAGPMGVRGVLNDVADVLFINKDGLERLVARAAGRSAWRTSTSDALAGKFRARFTHQVLAREVVGLVHRVMTAEAQHPSA